MKKLKEGSLLPRFSVTRPVTVVMIFVALLVVGYIAYIRIPLEMVPTDYEMPFMGVWVPYPNASPEEVEKLIVRPVEDVIGTISNVRQTTASARQDGAWIGIQFTQGTDLDVAYAEVRDRMERVKADLPDDVERVFVRRFEMGADAEMWYGLRVNKEVEDLYYFIDHNLARKIRRVDGVASVEIHGAEEKSFEIKLKLDELSASRISVRQLIERLNNMNFTLPAGHVREGDKRFYIRTSGRYNSIEEIAKLQISDEWTLGDIAEVSFDVPERQDIQRINLDKGVFMGIIKEAGANSVRIHEMVTEVVESTFADNPRMDAVDHFLVFSQGQLIIDSLRDLQETAMWAAMFAILLLFFFLRHVRMTLVITLAIPISLLATLVFMYFTGETLNLLTLMGLMVSVGLVVDNSVVVVENIFRHRRTGDDPKDAAIKGAGEVALAVVMATLTTIVVFIPMIVMGESGILSYILGRIGFPVVFGLLSSLGVALIFIPLTTTRIKDKGNIGRSKLIDWARDKYVDALGWAIKHRIEMVLLSLIIFVSIIAVTSDMGFQEGLRGTIDTTIRVRLGKRYTDPAGEPMRIASMIEQWCDEHADRLDYDIINTNVNKEWIRVRLYRNNRRNAAEMLEKPQLWLSNMFFINDMQRDPETERREFIRENLMSDLNLLEDEAELYMGFGGGDEEEGSITLVLEGRDYRTVREWAEEIREDLLRQPGIINVETGAERGRKQLVITIDRVAAAKLDVDTAWAAMYISQALRGSQLPRWQGQDREIRILARLREEDRQDIEDLRNLNIPSRGGAMVPLNTFASIELDDGPSRITHWNKRPNVSLDITSSETRIDRLSQLVAARVEKMRKPGHSYAFGNRFRQAFEQQSDFQFALLTAVVFVFLLMGFLFESFALPLTIICCVPFAFAGSQLLLKLYSMPPNLFAFIGIIIIVGVVVNNGIVLVDLINRQRKKGMDRMQAITLAGYYRFRPILMTAGTTIFSLIPMAFGDSNLVGIPYNPLGMAMIGGLLLNSMLTLLMVPVFYTLFDDCRKVYSWLIGILFGKSKSTELPAPGGASASSKK